MPKIQSADVKALVEELEAAAERFGLTYTPSDDLEETVNYGLQIPTVLISILARESNQGVKVSLRSRRGVDVCKIAMGFGGGGPK